MGPYWFVDPKLPEAQLLAMQWQAVPSLLEALENRTLSPAVRGSILAILSLITNERDLDPMMRDLMRRRSILPDYKFYSAKNCWHESGVNEYDLSAQRRLTGEWLRFKRECLEIREAPN